MTQADPRLHRAHFEVEASADGWCFRLLGFGEAPLLTSRAYASAAAAIVDIERLRDGLVRLAPCMSPTGLFYFHGKDATGEVIGASAMFEVPNERDSAQALVAELVRVELPIVQTDPRRPRA